MNDDFRENLIIDRYDPIFNNMREKKRKDLLSDISEDALTWNVFRSLRQIDYKYWFPRLFRFAFSEELKQSPQIVSVNLWKWISPQEIPWREGKSEIDIIIETENIAWFIEAKYRSPISLKVKYNPKRDQIIRNIDVGSWYAKKKGLDFYFSLLYSEKEPPKGIELLNKYSSSRYEMLSQLQHRSDDLSNIKEIGSLTWSNLACLMAESTIANIREDEKYIANKVLGWLEKKRISEE